MAKPEEYKHIEAWGRFLGSDFHYIQGEQSKAAAENAPINAIHPNRDGTWSTVDEIRSEATRKTIEDLARANA